MTLLIIYLLLALGFSFLCSIMEAVLLSTPMPFIKAKEQEGHKRAATLEKYKKDIDKPLAAILSINTIAHTVGAAGVGAQATIIFGEVYFGLISAILTILILVFSEIIPKTIGAKYWRSLAMGSTTILSAMIFISYPLVLVSRMISELFGKNGKGEQTVSREELGMMAEIGVKEGIFEEKESRIITNLIKLSKVLARHIMTPRTVLVAAPETMPLKKLYDEKKYLRYSRIPVYREDIHHITGYITKYDLLEKIAARDDDILLKEIMRDILYAEENTSVPDLFEMMIARREQISLINDEFGSAAGIVTMEDIIETMLGYEILDEYDEHVDMQQLAIEKWKIRNKKLNIKYADHDDFRDKGSEKDSNEK